MKAIGLLGFIGALLAAAQLRFVLPFFSLQYEQFQATGYDAEERSRFGTVSQHQNVIISTFADARDTGSRLVAGDYCLRINEVGSLVIERRHAVIWRANTYAFYFHEEWEKVFLVLADNGLLMLVQEVRTSPNQMVRGCEPVMPNGTSCRVVVWTSRNTGPSSDSKDYIVELGSNGELKVEDTQKRRVLWSTRYNKESERSVSVHSHYQAISDRPSSSTRMAPVVEETSVKIAWLMSFPNSGTSYTLQAVRRAGKQIAATNYGKEKATWDERQHSMPVYKSESSGPFWVGPLQLDYTLPSTFVLTKTHCGGYCMNCTAEEAFENLRSFLLQCRSGMYHYTNERGLPAQRKVTYEAEIVARAVHLFRNPFANVVSRFHHELNTKNLDYPDTREGFLSHCQMLNEKFGTREQIAEQIDPVAVEALEKVPCRSEFFRYTQWHNLAFEATEQLAIPTLILHYENYSSRFNETVSEVLDFLDQEWRGATPEFITGKEHFQFYTKAEMVSVKTALQAMSSSQTWRHISHYFD